jgi:hypothetical protein
VALRRQRQMCIRDRDWIGCEFNYTIDNDGTIDDLGNKVNNLLQHIR